MLSLGYPVHVVAAWLGHDPVMTQRLYAHVHVAEMRSHGEAFGQAMTPISECQSPVPARHRLTGRWPT
jgi:hypothetical protein